MSPTPVGAHPGVLVSRSRAAATAVAVVVLSAPLLHPASPGARALVSDDEPAWRDVLDRAVSASRSSAFAARMAIVGFSSDGPNVTEVALVQGDDGEVMVGHTEAWMVGRGDGEAFLWQPDDAAPRTGPGPSRARRAGTLLRLGGVEPAEFTVEALLDKYTVEIEGRRELATGAATVVTLRDRATDARREQLYVDAATDLVVRRDTFHLDGRPARLVALTDLDVGSTATSETMPEPDDAVETTHRGPMTALDAADRDALSQRGWVIPDELEAGYRLTAGFRMPSDCRTCGDRAADRPSLRLVYSDGLYTVSLYEQPGRVADSALHDAVLVHHGDLHVYRWPGSEPERMVWSGEGRTFTVVSDAPHDEVLDAISALPCDAPPGLARRVGRGLGRVAAWLWPFD